MKRIYQPLTAGILAATVLSGCASMPQVATESNYDLVQTDAVSTWANTPAIQYRTISSRPTLIEPNRIPAELYEKSITLNTVAPITVSELVSLLQFNDIPVVTSDPQIGKEVINMPKFTGSAGQLLSTLSAISDLNFNWESNVLLISDTGDYMVSVPQNEDVINGIAETLSSLGADNVNSSIAGGLISYQATNRDQKHIKVYLDRMAANTAVITMQLAVINVNMDDNANNGIDWGTLELKAGDLNALGSSSNNSPTAAAALLGQSAAGTLVSESLSLATAFNLLKTYGESQTLQNLTLKTLSGIDVSLKSGDSIPSIKNVSLNVMADSGATSGAEIETINTGFDIKVAPYFDEYESVVTLDLSLDLKSLVGYRDIAAGSSIGTLSIPQIKDQNFSNLIRMKVGETALVGGLISETDSANFGTLSGLEKLKNLASKRTTKNRSAMFVLVRPSVVIYQPQVVITPEAE